MSIYVAFKGNSHEIERFLLSKTRNGYFRIICWTMGVTETFSRFFGEKIAQNVRSMKSSFRRNRFKATIDPSGTLTLT